MRSELTKLIVPVSSFKFEELPDKNGGKYNCRVPEEFISSLPEEKDWDRVRFTAAGYFKEYEFEGVEIKPKTLVFYLGDRKLQS